MKYLLQHYPPFVGAVAQVYQERYPRKGLGVYETPEWNRVAFASLLAKGSSVLDVGSGNGALLTLLHHRGGFERLQGIDIRRLKSLRLPEGVQFEEMSIYDLGFRDRSFDTVICMEVIEHLPVDMVGRALSELRRVARDRLVMTVPYEEEYPLFHQDREGGHKQRFEDGKLRRLFPGAWITQLPHHRVNWALIVEDRASPAPGYSMMPAREFCSHFQVQTFLPPEVAARPRHSITGRLSRALRERLTYSHPVRESVRRAWTWNDPEEDSRNLRQWIFGHYPPYVRRAVEVLESRIPVTGVGAFGSIEWNRVAFGASLAIGESVLDAGLGNGAFLHLCHQKGGFKRLHGIDIRRIRSLRLPEGVAYRDMSVLDLKFADKEFDTVNCMEVIEHLPPEDVPRALSELRRVARRRLVMTVPYNEPEPLYHHDLPSGHKQSFDDEKLRRLFPHSVATLITSATVPWVLILEEPGMNSGFSILDSREFSARFHVLPPLKLRRSWLAHPLVQNVLSPFRRVFPVDHPIRRLYRGAKRVMGLGRTRFIAESSRLGDP